jgi:spore coat polysaccharide biosynthesis protein SpsF
MITAIIQARLGSSRLPGKVLQEVNGRPLLSYMLERVAAAKRVGQVVVATTDRPQDDKIAEFCQKERVFVFRGNENDVLDRYYQCALELKAESIVRLTSDCPVIDPGIIDDVVETYFSGDYDYVANTVPPVGTYPDGMDVEVFSYAALERAWREAKKPSDREHVTFYFWQNSQIFKTYRHDLKENLSHYRLTVDYPEDFEAIRAILLGLYQQNPLFSLSDIVTFLKQNPDVQAKNASRTWNQGWQTAFKKDKQSGF